MQWAPIWLGIKGFFSKAWEAIKKLPHWALIAFFFLIAVAFTLLKRSSTNKKLLDIQKEVAKVEKEHSEKISEANNLSRREEKKIKEEHEEKIKALKQEEDELNDAEVKGPVAVASEWSKFLLNRKKEDK